MTIPNIWQNKKSSKPPVIYIYIYTSINRPSELRPGVFGEAFLGRKLPHPEHQVQVRNGLVFLGKSEGIGRQI